ncbi:hypothetical protein CEXT_262711, partial [Caerostris extrusa]
MRSNAFENSPEKSKIPPPPAEQDGTEQIPSRAEENGFLKIASISYGRGKTYFDGKGKNVCKERNNQLFLG